MLIEVFERWMLIWNRLSRVCRGRIELIHFMLLVAYLRCFADFDIMVSEACEARSVILKVFGGRQPKGAKAWEVSWRVFAPMIPGWLDLTSSLGRELYNVHVNDE